jgi:RimJ/RimL family protein N-acetyltransferase
VIPGTKVRIILETERLILREPTIDDASFMLRLVNEPSWLQYIGDRHVYSLDDARQYLLNGAIKSFAENGFGFAIVILKKSGEWMGMCGLVKRPFLDSADIGFAFFPEYTGQGYALEAATATLDYAYNDLHMPRIVAITSPDNMRSISLLKKLGLQFETDIDVDGEKLFLFAKNNN